MRGSPLRYERAGKSENHNTREGAQAKIAHILPISIAINLIAGYLWGWKKLSFGL
jgi:hypothetical protein